MTYTAIIEDGGASWGAYVPDLPGCTAVASTRGRVEELIREAVEEHVALLRERGDPVPAPSAIGTIEIDAA